MKKLSWYKGEADRLFSLIKRQSAQDHKGEVKCCTCHITKAWRHQQLGHFITRGKLPTRFEDRNTDIQCGGCNGPRSGKQFEFGIFLDNKHGEGTAKEMLELSRTTKKITRIEYIDMINEFKKQLNDGGYLLR